MNTLGTPTYGIPEGEGMQSKTPVEIADTVALLVFSYLELRAHRDE
jgi:hypothetical protein